MFTGQINKEGFKKTTNTETRGRYHTDWLNMMYPRLRLARNLLHKTGFIVIAIDDSEVENLIKICDEIFGWENKIGIVTVVHKPEGRNQGKFFGTSNEFALFYAKNKSFANFNRVILDDNLRATYDRKDEHGIFKPNNYLREGGGDCNLRKNKPNFWYPIYVSPDLKEIILNEKDGYFRVLPISKSGQERTWKTIKETFVENLRKGNIFAEKDKDEQVQVYEKYRENQVIKSQVLKSV